MLRVARALLAVRDPLDAELVVARMLGAWWGQHIPGMSGDRVEQHLTEGLVAHAAASGTPAGLALLSGVAALGASEQARALAGHGVAALSDRGDLHRPAWADQVGRVTAVAAHRSRDRFGDADELICVFRRGGAEAADSAADGLHALIAVVDHNAGGVLRDAWVTAKVERTLEHCRAEASGNPMALFEEIAPARARTLLERALERTDRVVRGGADDRPARLTAAGDAELRSPSLAAHHALLRSRLRSLPAEEPACTGPVWRRDARSMLAARFLASEEAAELSDSYAASRCVDRIIGYGCDVDAGRPLRVSPRKVETFLLTWLPRRVVLLPEEQEAMPHVLGAWIRWAGPRCGLPEPAVGACLDALWESTGEFARVYDDPAAALGLGRREIRRLLPDGDLDALPRRMFAFPLLAGDLVDQAEDAFDPMTRQGRRALLRLDHFGELDGGLDGEERRGRHSVDGGRTGPQPAAPRSGGEDSPAPGSAESRGGRGAPGKDGAAGAHGAPGADGAPAGADRGGELDAHERLALRLWHGDPPELWAAAERLLDRGRTRPDVLATLLAALSSGGDADPALLTARLREL
ncbi:hypothetical protein [Nocardiopsis coralliicola]